MSIYWQFIILIYSYFVLGWLLIATDSLLHRNGTRFKNRATKFFMYFLIVNLVFFSIILSGLTCLLFLVFLFSFGLWDIAGQSSGSYPKVTRKAKLIAIPVYLVIWLLIFIKTPLGKEKLLWIYAMVVVFDGFSQITGQLMGKRKITPWLSPNKTLEGLIGGIVMTMLSAVIIRGWLCFSIPVALELGLGISLASFAGDLLASWYKRSIQIKDYSRLILGHGGILDRFDSFILALCAFPFLNAFVQFIN